MTKADLAKLKSPSGSANPAVYLTFSHLPKPCKVHRSDPGRSKACFCICICICPPIPYLMGSQPLIVSVAICAAILVVGAIILVGSPLWRLPGDVALWSSGDRQYKDTLTHYFPALPENAAILPAQAHSLEEFTLELRVALDKQQLPKRAIDYIFQNEHVLSQPHPNCGGTWMEFGVFTGSSINMAADFRKRHCAEESPTVFGFDTFQGLPEAWGTHRKELYNDGQGQFSLGGKMPDVRKNVKLVQGLFSASLPPFLEQHYQSRELEDITYLHIDCDLYQGAIDALKLLDKHIAPGCILLFDDLVNYPQYQEHELKALWEWLVSTGRQIQVIGVLGPLPGDKKYAMELKPPQDMGWFHQSVAFVVL